MKPTNNTPEHAPTVEWLATAASRIYAGRPETSTPAAVGKALDIWHRSAALALAEDPPDWWKLAVDKSDRFEKERLRLSASGIDIDRAAGRREAVDVAFSLQPPGSKKKDKGALSDLQNLAVETLRDFDDLRMLAGAQGRRPSGEIDDLAAGIPCAVSVTTARTLYHIRARIVRLAKSEAGKEGGRPKERGK